MNMKMHRASWTTKIWKAYQEGRLYRRVCFILRLWLRKSRYLMYNPAANSVRLHCPEYVIPKNDELEMVGRIFESFKKMKKDQAKASAHYMPSSYWEGLFNKAYIPLTSALKDNDINKFHFFLSNFGAWKEYNGIESTELIRDNNRSFLGRRYLKNEIFYNQLKMWKWHYNNRKTVSCLTYPIHGNQAGAYIDGTFVGAGSFFSEIYGSILSGLISDIERPVIAEIGAGYGKLAYLILKNMNKFVYVDFDLPETICVAAYYLMKTYPDKKTLLYGENEYRLDAYKKYDLIFMPSSEIVKVEDPIVDLFVNKNSLGEMTKDAVHNYIKCIAKVTKGYFFHMNHDVHANIYENSECGMLGYEYPMPADAFTLVFRYPDIGHMLYQGFLDFNVDIFMYLYARKNLQRCPHP